MRLFSFVFLALFNPVFSQTKEGAWDNIRTTNETFLLKSNEKKLVKSADFPLGTTEAVFRITLLDDNQKLSGSLVSVLKSIPDPTGISQGAAGGVFLLSAISGEDKCTYTIFRSAADAENYIGTGKKINACFVQQTPVNKEVKLLSSDSKCLESSTRNLYFVFESDNFFFREKVVLEIVPWVNSKLSRGWDKQAKNVLLEVANGLGFTRNLLNREVFNALFIEYIENKFTYQEYGQLLKAEKTRLIETAVEESLKKSGELEKYYNAIRERSQRLFIDGKTEAAIDLINVEMIAKKRASYRDYGILGDYHLITGQFSKAEVYYKEGLKQNPGEILFELNLAHVYMFTGRLQQSKEIHRKYKNENLSLGKSWVAQTKKDFREFEKRKLPTDQFKKIMRIIE